MQKVIRRTIMAEKQVARRAAKRAENRDSMRRWNTIEQNAYRGRAERKLVRDERVARREDWEMGSLAPKRNVGADKEVYGSLDPLLTRGPQLSKPQRKELEKEIKERYVKLVPGDQVIVLGGREKGKIGRIKEIDMERGELTVENVNMTEQAVVEMLRPRAKEQGQSLIQVAELPIPIQHIRLVHEVDGQNMIINKLVRTRERVYNPLTERDEYHRLIDGTDIVVPWPAREEPVHEDQPVDTRRADVEARSFIPTLLRPPMPLTVIDELRNKFSIFRTRHEPEYVARKEAEDREAAAKKVLSKQMQTPQHEIRRKERKLRRAEKKGTLTRSMMTRIGKIIAQKKQLLVDAAGPKPSSGTQLLV